MKKIALTLFTFHILAIHAFGWGQTGHRIVGQIAEWHLNKRAEKRISGLLGPTSLAMTSTWMDEIKSVPAYDYLNSWHYLTVKENGIYDPDLQEAGGDAYNKTKMIISALKNGELDSKQELEYLKMLVHLVGDLHQPLHVGTGEDRGGNDVEVTYFNQKTNLHAVWDSRVIDGKNLSYTELAEHLNRRSTKQIVRTYQSNGIEIWLKEAVELRPIIYDLPEDKRLFYEYGYKTYPVIEERLLVGGIRLAGILNEIYG